MVILKQQGVELPPGVGDGHLALEPVSPEDTQSSIRESQKVAYRQQCDGIPTGMKLVNEQIDDAREVMLGNLDFKDALLIRKAYSKKANMERRLAVWEDPKNNRYYVAKKVKDANGREIKGPEIARSDGYHEPIHRVLLQNGGYIVTRGVGGRGIHDLAVMIRNMALEPSEEHPAGVLLIKEWIQDWLEKLRDQQKENNRVPKAHVRTNQNIRPPPIPVKKGVSFATTPTPKQMPAKMAAQPTPTPQKGAAAATPTPRRH